MTLTELGNDSEALTLTKGNANDLFKQIEEVIDLEDALNLLKKIELLEILLKQANIFEQNSVNYAKLHLEALLKIVMLGGENQLPRKGYTKRAAIWVSKMDTFEKEEILKLIEQGLSVEQIYKQNVFDKEKEQQRTDKLTTLREKLLDECAHNGIVDLGDYRDNVCELVHDKSMAFDIIDGTRGALRKMGAVGVEPFSDLYVLPTEDNDFYVEKAIVTRIESICKDIARIKALIDHSKVKISHEDAYERVQGLWDNHLHYFDRGMKGTAWASIHGNQLYVVYLMLVFAEIGVFKDEDSFYKDIILGFSNAIEKYNETSYYNRSRLAAYDFLRKQLDSALNETANKPNGDATA